MLRLHPSALDIVLLVIYFVADPRHRAGRARRSVGTSADFLLAGRSLPAWVTGLAFISANLGATEILGQAANGAQFGVATVHYYWVGAVPAMVFLGIVMMPFYYRSKVRSVPEFLRVRFNDPTHVLNAVVFALSAVLIAGVNLYALAIVLQSLLGVNLYLGIVVSAAFVLVYIGAGGLSSAIYGEVLQFFVILAGLIPLTIAAVVHIGGFNDLGSKVIKAFKRQRQRPARLGRHRPRRAHPANPIGADFIGIVLGLGLRAVLRLLDDELRRGAARAVGQGRVGPAPHADHRRLPEAAHPGRHGHPRPGRRRDRTRNFGTADRT